MGGLDQPGVVHAGPREMTGGSFQLGGPHLPGCIRNAECAHVAGDLERLRGGA
ncbi:MAG: hypothetical protein RL430_947 [Actinomycetota bacterium]